MGSHPRQYSKRSRFVAMAILALTAVATLLVATIEPASAAAPEKFGVSNSSSCVLAQGTVAWSVAGRGLVNQVTVNGKLTGFCNPNTNHVVVLADVTYPASTKIASRQSSNVGTTSFTFTFSAPYPTIVPGTAPNLIDTVTICVYGNNIGSEHCQVKNAP